MMVQAYDFFFIKNVVFCPFTMVGYENLATPSVGKKFTNHHKLWFMRSSTVDSLFYASTYFYDSTV